MSARMRARLATAEPAGGLDRRSFLRISALAGGGLVAGFAMSAAPLAALAQGAAAVPAQGAGPAPALRPNAFVRITPDNIVTVIIGHTEMGQGVATAIPMIVAEELDADWPQVRWEQSPTAPAYQNPVMHQQLTGGSITTQSEYEPQRRAGAAVRAVLVQAAANRWKVEPASLRTDRGRVIHDASQRSASYGDLATEAVGIAPPANPPLKDPKTFRIIGQPVRRLDTWPKVDGSAKFGMDVQLPGMLTALIARPPLFGGKVKTYDATATKAIAGVVGVYEIPQGIAVVAKDFWSASRGRAALELSFDPVLGERISSDAQRESYRHLMATAGTPARRDGDVAPAQKAAAKTVTADYHFPYLTHATMEPLHAVIDYRGGDSAEVWMGTQWPEGDQTAAAQLLGLKKEQVKVNTMLTGGGFGRRSSLGFDVILAAAAVAKQVKQPVKVIWTRDQDIRGGYYRPASYCRLTATLDASGAITSWSDRIAVQSIGTNTPMEAFIVKDGVDSLSVEGAYDLPYAIPNVLVDLHTPRYQVPVLWMRSVGHSFNAFAVECFVDEVAAAAKKDPLALRRELLKAKPRHLGVLNAVARLAHWTTPPAPGVTRGIVVHESYGSFVGNVVEATVGADKTLTVHRVYCAIDCGVAINTDLVKAQMESGIVFGLSSALFGEITLERGEVQQSNYDDYPVLRMYQTPKIDVVVVPSMEAPGGVGEPGVAGVAPALANAIFAATGTPVRSLPLKHDFKIA